MPTTNVELKQCPFCDGKNTRINATRRGVTGEIECVTLFHRCKRVLGVSESTIIIRRQTLEEVVSVWNGVCRDCVETHEEIEQHFYDVAAEKFKGDE